MFSASNSSMTHAVFEVESKKGSFVRGDVARAIVESGWDLNELRPAAMSLEEVFLQLTGTEAVSQPETPSRGASLMRNVWIICQKELRSYFVSPVAYILLTHVRTDLRILFLERARFIRLRRHSVADERPFVSHELE